MRTSVTGVWAIGDCIGDPRAPKLAHVASTQGEVAVDTILGEEAAMACTDAIETEIDLHYKRQLDSLGNDDPELSADIAEFRDEEIEHRDTARAAGAERAPAYPLLTGAIRAACRVAIGLSKRI